MWSSTTQIREAIAAQKGVSLPVYQLDPINPSDMEGWLDRNQEAHSDFTGALGLQSSDLREVDLRDRAQLEAWIWLSFTEIQSACHAQNVVLADRRFAVEQPVVHFVEAALPTCRLRRSGRQLRTWVCELVREVAKHVHEPIAE